MEPPVDVRVDGSVSSIIGCLAAAFFACLVPIVLPNAAMFVKHKGRRHGAAGALYLAWLIVGYIDTFWHDWNISLVTYDSVLGVLGIALTLSAAADFPSHRLVKNRVSPKDASTGHTISGTLDQTATVTTGEMLEHSFYQALNLVQALYLHWLGSRAGGAGLLGRLAGCLAATSPWLLRGLFPVNSFSDNYASGTPAAARAWTFIGIMYRTKKWQYVFYKHFLLHGLNVSAALAPPSRGALAAAPFFRHYWLLLNTSYVMEFFLQTLVKKRYMAQATMLRLQQLLMAASSAAALRVLRGVSLPLAALSLALNFMHRGHDFANTAVLVALAFALPEGIVR